MSAGEDISPDFTKELNFDPASKQGPELSTYFNFVQVPALGCPEFVSAPVPRLRASPRVGVSTVRVWAARG